MHGIAVAVSSLLRPAISKLWSYSSARISPEFMLALLVVLLPASVLIFTTNLRATSNFITVNTLGDSSSSSDGLCSLREAINNANAKSDTTGGDCVAGTGTDTIDFSLSGTIALTNSLPPIANSSGDSLTIDGGGHTITIDGGSAFQVLSVNSGATLNLSDLTVTRGSVSYPNSGAAVFNAGTLKVVDSTFSSNSMAGQDCCSLGGGAISTTGKLTVTGSTFSKNATTSRAASGGAIEIHSSGTATVTNSTFSNNSSQWQGGAIQVQESGGLTLMNSTFSGNTAQNFGDSLYNSSSGTVTVQNSLFVYGAGGSNANCSGNAVTNGGYNIASDSSCAFGTSTGASGQTIGDDVAPKLSLNGLLNNGGPTQTIALQSTSPAIDAIPFANCPGKDQRGDPRPDAEDSAGSSCDIGAFEFAEAVPTPSATATLTATPTPTQNATATLSATPTAAATKTATSTATQKETPTASPTATLTATSTGTPTATASASPTPIGPLNVSTSNISFRNQKVGTKSKRKVIKLSNPISNKGPIVITSVADSTGEFVVSSNTCGSSISVGSKCKIGVSFKPASNGQQTDTLTVSDNASNAPQRVSLSGFGMGGPTATPAATTTATATATSSSTATLTATPTRTATPTATLTSTATPTSTSATQTATATRSATPTPTSSSTGCPIPPTPTPPPGARFYDSFNHPTLGSNWTSALSACTVDACNGNPAPSMECVTQESQTIGSFTIPADFHADLQLTDVTGYATFLASSNLDEVNPPCVGICVRADAAVGVVVSQTNVQLLNEDCGEDYDSSAFNTQNFPIVDDGQFHTYEFQIDAAGNASVYRDGNLLATVPVIYILPATGQPACSPRSLFVDLEGGAKIVGRPFTTGSARFDNVLVK